MHRQSATDANYFTHELRFDNVLVGDYVQIGNDQQYAQGKPLAHIRAVPEGGTAATRKKAAALDLRDALDRRRHGRLRDVFQDLARDQKHCLDRLQRAGHDGDRYAVRGRALREEENAEGYAAPPSTGTNGPHDMGPAPNTTP